MTKFQAGDTVEFVDPREFDGIYDGRRFIVVKVIRNDESAYDEVTVRDVRRVNSAHSHVTFFAVRLKLVEEDWGPSVTQAWVDNTPERTVLVELPLSIVKNWGGCSLDYGGWTADHRATIEACRKALGNAYYA